jgi:hypothetical protein
MNEYNYKINEFNQVISDLKSLKSNTQIYRINQEKKNKANQKCVQTFQYKINSLTVRGMDTESLQKEVDELLCSKRSPVYPGHIMRQFMSLKRKIDVLGCALEKICCRMQLYVEYGKTV